MNIKRITEIAKTNRKVINELSTAYMDNILYEIMAEFKVNKTVAKYLLMKATSFNVIKSEISDQIHWLEENNAIHED